MTIGRYAFVGAGAVVNRNVPDHAMVVGNPGKRIGWVRRCGERLSDDLECGEGLHALVAEYRGRKVGYLVDMSDKTFFTEVLYAKGMCKIGFRESRL